MAKPDATAQSQPTRYSETLGREICRRISEGETLTAICKNKDMPSRMAVNKWAVRYEDFSLQLRASRLRQADSYFDQIKYLADNADIKAGAAAINKARLQVDTHKWIIAKLNPAKYADSARVELTGKGGKDLVPATDSRQTARAVLSLLQSGVDVLPGVEVGKAAKDKAPAVANTRS